MGSLPPLSELRIEGNTIIREHVPAPERRIEYEIGDRQQPDFFPQFKTKHWDNEANLSVRLKAETYEAGEIAVIDGAVIWKQGAITARLFELDAFEGETFEDGGFEFEVEFASRPSSNVVEYTLQSKGLDFFHQPALPDEIDERTGQTIVVRPEHVVGSYAVYHQTRRDNRIGGKHYRTGKAFHIYRPFAEDADGKRAWCELHIAGDLMTVTVPPDFLDRARYPVRVDPTFGYTTAGASNGRWWNHRISCKSTMAAEDGTLDSISFHCNSFSATTGLWRLNIYVNSTRALLAQANELSSASSGGTAYQWRTATVTGSPSLGASTGYDLGGKASANTDRHSFDTGGPANSFLRWPHTYADPVPDPETISFSLTEIASIYATYTAAGGGEDLVRVFGEAIAANDQTLRAVGLARVRTNAVGLAQVTMGLRALVRLRSEAAAISETAISIVQAIGEAVVRAVTEAVAMAETVARSRRLARIRSGLVGITGAVARVGGIVGAAAAAIISGRIRMRVRPSSRLSVKPPARMNVPPARQ